MKVSCKRAKYHCSIVQEIVVSCSDWSKNRYVISSWLSYGLLHASFDLCLVVMWCLLITFYSYINTRAVLKARGLAAGHRSYVEGGGDCYAKL